MASASRNRQAIRLLMGKRHFLCAALAVMTLTSCTSIGPSSVLPDIDMGPQVELQVCIYKDANVSDRQAASIIAAIQKEFAQFGLIIQAPSIKEWQRPSFKHQGILRDIANRPLEPPFDRSLALVGRNAGDFFWGTLLPEILGAVETKTHTKGYVIAEIGSLNQLLMLSSPEKAAVHEFYHMLGVEHEDGRLAINKKIARLKRQAIENRQAGRDFFPGIDSNGKFLLSRETVNRQYGPVPEKTMASQTKPE